MSEKITALAIQIKGEIVSSNFEDFKAEALEKIDSMNYQLVSDDDFKRAKEDIKNLDVTGKALKGAKEEVLKQLDDVYALMNGIDEIIAAADKCRLAKGKEVRERDAQVRAQIIDDALNLIDHPKREKYRATVADGAKGKRSFKTMAEGADKVAKGINDSILKTRDVLDQFENEHGKLLIPDRVDLELQDAEGVANELRHRLEKKRDEEEKKRLKEEAEKARQETEAAKEPESLPEPPKVDTIPVGLSKPDQTAVATNTPPSSEGESPKEEMARFISIVTSAFAPVKDARAQLKHPENIQAAGEFAKSLGEAWAELKSQAS